MTEHTPGPWNIRKQQWDGANNMHAIRGEACGLANAQLIAAAPDLLAALEEMTTEYHAVREGQGWYYELESITKARAAIAKAKP